MSTKKNDNTELAVSLLKFTTYCFIENSNLNLKLIEKRIQFYQTLINDLKDDKPLFFQKKKLIDYNNKLEEYNKKINDLYIEFNEEIMLLEKLNEYI